MFSHLLIGGFTGLTQQEFTVIPDMHTGMIPIEDTRGFGKMLLLFAANPPSPVANIDDFLRFAETASAGVEPKLPAKSLGVLKAADMACVPMEPLILPIETTDLGFMPAVMFTYGGPVSGDI